MLSIEKLDFNYQNKNNLFSDLSLEIETGKIYGLLGKNGSGKTSLLRIMAGLLFPKKGNSKLFGMEASRRLPAMLQEIYLVPEEFTLPDISVKAYLDIYAAFYPNFDFKAFNKMLSDFVLEVNGSLNSFSYGQKKKFLLAFALATNCKLLLLDEPVNGLDIPSKSAFRKVVANALQDDRTFIISTHEVREVENLIDSVTILHDGKIIFNYPLELISKKLSFVKGQSQASANNLYQEKNLMGVNKVVPNKGEADSLVDLELLFNAVLANHEKINFLVGS